MKASEVLRRYRAGQRDFQGVNLRGQSFKGQDLSGANFSYADIRGADFTNTILKDANFSYAKHGLQSHQVFFLTVISAILAIVFGFAAAFTGIVVGISLQSRTNNLLSIVIALTGLVIFCTVVFRKGVITIIAALIILLTMSGVLSVALVTALTWEGSGVLGGSVVFTLAAVAGASMIGALLLAIAGFSGGSVAVISVLIAAVTGVLTGSFFAVKVVKAVPQVWLLTLGWVGAMAVVTALISAYVSRQTLAGNDKYSLIHAIAVTFASTGGTSFRGANLTDANFTKATLKNTDFKKANLNRTCWHQAKKLDFANMSMTYFEKHIVQQLLITKEGINKNFDDLTLRRINLHGANLVDSSFTDADLIGANLQDADLSGAELVRTQLDGTDLTGATLTGATIEDWNINNQTILDNVICDYIYLKIDQQERRPADPNKNFEPGEFAKLVETSIETVDLIFKNGIDWKAFLTSFQDLRVEYGEQNVSIQAIEKKSDGAFVIRLSVPPEVNKAEIESHAKESYETKLKIVDAEHRAELKSLETHYQKEIITFHKKQGADMMEIARLLASRPINVEAKAVAEHQSKNVEVEMNFQAPVTGAAGKVSGDMNVYAPEQKKTLAEAAGEIQKLLKQLEQTNPTATEAEKITYVNDETTPSFKRQAASALKAAGETAIDEFLDNPYVKVGKAAIMGWMKPESD